MRNLFGLSLLPVCALSFAANAPVEDLGSGMPPMQRSGPVAAASVNSPQSGNQALTDLHFEVQSLRDEVRDLRGIVEEQANELQQLRQRQLDDYQDLDRRISGAASSQSPGQPQTGVPAASTRLPPASPETDSDFGSASSSADDLPAASSGGESEGAYEAYTAAYNLLKAKKVDESVASFNVFVAKFPNSQYTANAYYWLGEIFVLQNNLADAEKAFAMVKDKFPAHRKANDAKFKLAKVYHLQGETEKARSLLTEVAGTNSGAASLAKAYLNENF